MFTNTLSTSFIIYLYTVYPTVLHIKVSKQLSAKHNYLIFIELTQLHVLANCMPSSVYKIIKK